MTRDFALRPPTRERKKGGETERKTLEFIKWTFIDTKSVKCSLLFMGFGFVIYSYVFANNHSWRQFSSLWFVIRLFFFSIITLMSQDVFCRWNYVVRSIVCSATVTWPTNGLSIQIYDADMKANWIKWTYLGTASFAALVMLSIGSSSKIHMRLVIDLLFIGVGVLKRKK